MENLENFKNTKEQEIEQESITISIGDIFIDDKNYSKRAEWCNKNGCYIKEIEPKEDGTRQFQIKETVVPVLTLDELKQEKHAQLKAIMQAKRNALTCEYNDDVFDCNEQAQTNMNSLIGLANLGMTEFPIRSTNERTPVLSREQLVELAITMSKTVNSLYSEYWDLKDALYECKTKEEVDDISWE